LDTYQPEREPHVRAMIELAIGMGRIVCTLDREAAAQRDADMIARLESGAPGLPPLRPPPLTTGCVLAGHPGAGTVFPQPTSGIGRRRLRLDDALGDGAWLVCRRPTSLAHPDVRVVHLEDEGLAPFRAELLAWLDANKAEAVLVRPDRYVFAAGDPAVLLAAWAAAMGALQQAA
ncbi:MAG TPA: hypothetical protein VFH92_13950, partial [Phenylobacterium sp.]|nr:hypothetical protein [Phenylobacterium sp.]